MDFDALFNEKTFQFSDFQEFTVCFHGKWLLAAFQAVNTANAKLAPRRGWTAVAKSDV